MTNTSRLRSLLHLAARLRITETLRLAFRVIRAKIWLFSLTLAILFTAGVFEGFGIAMMLPALNRIVQPDASQGPIDQIVDTAFGVLGLEVTLGAILIAVVLAISVKALSNFLAQAVAGSTVARYAAELRVKILKTFLHARWSHVADVPAGRVSAAVTVEAEESASCLLSIIKISSAIIQATIQIGVALIVSWQVTLASFAVGSILVLLLAQIVQRTRTEGHRRRNAVEALSRKVVELTGGAKAIKAMALEGHALAVIRREIADLRTARRNLVLLASAVTTVREPLSAAALAAGLYFYLVVFEGNIGALFVLALLFTRIVQSIGAVQQGYQSLLANEPGFLAVSGLIESATAQPEPRGGARQVSLTRELCMEGLNFAHADKPTLRDVSLRIPAGAFIAFWGPSGAGKTSLIDLIVGLHQPQQGQVTVDAVPLSEIDLQSWRRRIGYVPQDTFLFNDSVFENVTLKDPAYSEAQVEAALKSAGAWPFVKLLPDGMHSPVGERGGQLSGGQRQRIAIARALVRQPKLLILDEATSGLDMQTEKRLLQTVQGLAGDVTIVAISHNPTVLSYAQTCYEVEAGVVRQIEAKERLALS